MAAPSGLADPCSQLSNQRVTTPVDICGLSLRSWRRGQRLGVLAWTSKRCMVGGRWFILWALAVSAFLRIALQLPLAPGRSPWPPPARVVRCPPEVRGAGRSPALPSGTAHMDVEGRPSCRPTGRERPWRAGQTQRNCGEATVGGRDLINASLTGQLRLPAPLRVRTRGACRGSSDCNRPTRRRSPSGSTPKVSCSAR